MGEPTFCETVFLARFAIAVVHRSGFLIPPLVTLAAFNFLRPTSTRSYLVKTCFCEIRKDKGSHSSVAL